MTTDTHMKYIFDLYLNKYRELIEESIIIKQYTPLFDGSYLGCGNYGCVYPTESDDVVLKITSDSDESRFVIASMSLKEWPEGLVQYYQIVFLSGDYKFPIFGLWRENALDVGNLSDTEVNPDFIHVLDVCWNIAKKYTREVAAKKM